VLRGQRYCPTTFWTLATKAGSRLSLYARTKCGLSSLRRSRSGHAARGQTDRASQQPRRPSRAARGRWRHRQLDQVPPGLSGNCVILTPGLRPRLQTHDARREESPSDSGDGLRGQA
jgi:hypothetical protein